MGFMERVSDKLTALVIVNFMLCVTVICITAQIQHDTMTVYYCLYTIGITGMAFIIKKVGLDGLIDVIKSLGTSKAIEASKDLRLPSEKPITEINSIGMATNSVEVANLKAAVIAAGIPVPEPNIEIKEQ